MPRVESPPGMAFTLHLTALEEEPAPVMLAVNACPAPVETDAEPGRNPHDDAIGKRDDGRRRDGAVGIA